MTNPFAGHEHRRPDVDRDEAERLLAAAFGRTGILRELGSHQDRNFLVAGEDGARFVLKVTRNGLSRAALDAENQAMLRVAAAGLEIEVPVPQPAADGSLIAEGTTSGGATHNLRLVTFVHGVPLDQAGYLAPPVLRAHGALAASVAVALAGFDHPALDRA